MTIKKEQQKWLMFDDTKVTKIDMSKAAALAQLRYMFVLCEYGNELSLGMRRLVFSWNVSSHALHS